MGSIIADTHARRAYIEGHLEMCRDGARRNLVEMGRWLNRAKDEHIVGHGEWTGWVAKYAGLNERTAQRLMRVAREIPEGSALEALGPAKLEELIKLPAAEREEAAEAMDAAGKSSRQVRDEVAAIRAERDEALRLVKAQKDAAEQEKQEAVRRAVEKLARAKEQQLDRATDVWAEKVRAAYAREEDLLGQIRQLKQQAQEMPDAAEVEALRLQKQAAEEEADRLADELDRLKTDRQQDDVGSATRIVSAIGGMMTIVGREPALLRDDPRRMSPDDWRLVIDRVALVRAWCDAMSEAWARGEEAAV